jgi:hypothetical protein
MNEAGILELSCSQQSERIELNPKAFETAHYLH